MKHPSDILWELMGLAVWVELSGDRLRFTPSSAIPLDLRDQIRAKKVDLIQILTPVEKSRSSCTLPYQKVPTVRAGAITNRETVWRGDDHDWVAIPAGTEIFPVSDLAKEWDRPEPLFWSFVEGLKQNNRDGISFRVGRLDGLIRMIRTKDIGHE